MITGVRPTAETAVRSGFEYIQFMKVDEEVSAAVDSYLRSLKPVPSPHLEKGVLNPEAEKGKIIFERENCHSCHPSPLYTDQKMHSMGRVGEYDRQNTWDTPTLAESWCTGPYLHDGRCATMVEVFSIEKHGLENDLSQEEIEQLVEYVLSL
jgi:cytochrome c peroxidase